MNAWKWILAVLGLLAIGGIMSQSVGGQISNDLRWSTDFKEAADAAKAQHKLLLVEFGATWCGPCKMLKRDVFSSAKFGERGKNFILVEIDIDKNQALAAGSNVGSIPDVRVISPDGKILGQEVGYGGPQDFYSWLDGVAGTQAPVPAPAIKI